MKTFPKYVAALLLAAFVSPSWAAGNERAAAGRAELARINAAQQPKKIDCSVSPDLCMTAPVARGCGEGKHWSSAGSGLAHCVEDDRDCANGKAATRDEYDNLVCADEKAAAEEAAREENVENASRATDQQKKEKTQ